MEKLKRQSARIIKPSTISNIPDKSAERLQPSKKLKNKFRKPIKPHQYGEIITVDETNLSGIISQPIETKRRRIQTGTEEILGDIVVLEDVQKDDPTPEPIQPKKKVRKRRSPSLEVFSESEDQPVHRKIKRTAVQQIIVSSDEELDDDIHGYQNIWEEALKEKASSTKEEFEVPEKKPYSVIPIPRAQPMHYLNKFISNKSLLGKPAFRTVGNRGPMMFSSFPMSKHFNGSDACSKVAGNILGDIIKQKKYYDGIFCMQIPNSLRVFNNQNVEEFEDRDIHLEKQNSSHFINDADTLFQQKRRNFQKPLALAGFSNSQPFGKLLLLKSGKIVLQVGTRRFDVVSTSPNHDHQTAVIVDFTGASQNTSSSFSQPHKMALHSLGRIQHVFSAFYNYSKILETLSPITSSKSQAHVEEVDLTADQCYEKIEKKEMNANDDDMLKRKVATPKKMTTKTSHLSQKSLVKNVRMEKKKNKKRVEPTKTKATNLRCRKPKPSN